MNKIYRIIIVMFMVFIFSTGILGSSRNNLTRFEWNTPQEETYVRFGQNIWKSQTFTIGTLTANKNYILVNIRLKLYKWLLSNEIMVSITAVDQNGFPTGSDLSTGTLDGNIVKTDSGPLGGEWYEINMSPYLLEKSKNYAIIVRSVRNFDTSSLTLKASDANSNYAGGKALRSDNSGTTWIIDSSIADLVFEVLTDNDSDSDDIFDSDFAWDL